MSTPSPAVTADSTDSTPTRGERLRLPLMLLGILIVAAGALYYWITGGRYISTDDAYVQAAQASISSNVAGRVSEIDVRDNQRVRRGDVLFRLDDQPFRIAVSAAEAKLGSVRLQIGAGKATYRQEQAALRSAQDSLAFRQKEYARQKTLLASGISSQAQFDQAQHALETARQQVVSAQQQLASVLTMLGGNPDIDPDQHPLVQEAQAELDRAKLNLSYATITAPGDGIVAKVEQLQVGDYINAASPVFALISSRDVWVEANFKEDQITHMRAGQPATVKIDTYSGKTFKARVASISPGTGSQFAALPAENATGNWVKVVQRLPVRLELENPDPGLPMHAGLSATVEVDTGADRKQSGQRTAATQ
ncbi:MAG: HlyD family secretion protein [Stenotrophobium sp.]